MLSLAEFRFALLDLGIELTDKQFYALVDEVDDGSGQIDMEEFRHTAAKLNVRTSSLCCASLPRTLARSHLVCVHTFLKKSVRPSAAAAGPVGAHEDPSGNLDHRVAGVDRDRNRDLPLDGGWFAPSPPKEDEAGTEEACRRGGTGEAQRAEQSGEGKTMQHGAAKCLKLCCMLTPHGAQPKVGATPNRSTFA